MGLVFVACQKEILRQTTNCALALKAWHTIFMNKMGLEECEYWFSVNKAHNPMPQKDTRVWSVNTAAMDVDRNVFYCLPGFVIYIEIV